jgi:hypothetical protein
MTRASGTEMQELLKCLTKQRAHVLGILEGLDDDALRRPVLPSGWTCLGLVQHLALDVEQLWFRAVAAGERSVIDGLADAGNAWLVDPAVPAAEILELYRRETTAATAIIAASSPDAGVAWWPEDVFGSFRMHTMRELVLHVIAETACHAGHLDAARELIDGRKWLVLTE